jgi:hypothetical protein
MATTKGDNGSSKYDPTFTKRVVDAMGPKTSPRMREVMTSLIQHVHDFAREERGTVGHGYLRVGIVCLDSR